MQPRFALGSFLSILLVTAYAIASYFTAIRSMPIPWAFVIALAPLSLAALVLIRKTFGLAAVAMAALILGWLVNHFQAELQEHVAATYYIQHMGMMLCGALIFGTSLLPSQVPLCTRFAHYDSQTMTPRLERYTRSVTVAWTLFFVGMAIVSTALFFSALPTAVWSAFDTMLTLPLVVLMFAAEYAVRRRILPHESSGGITSAYRSYQAYRADRARFAKSSR